MEFQWQSYHANTGFITSGDYVDWFIYSADYQNEFNTYSLMWTIMAAALSVIRKQAEIWEKSLWDQLTPELNENTLFLLIWLFVWLLLLHIIWQINRNELPLY